LPSQGSTYVFQKQDEVKFVGWAWLELGYEMNVEAAGFGGFGVYEQASTADVLRESDEPGKNVLEHSGSKPCALVIDVYTESSEQSYGLGVAPSAFVHPIGSRLRVQLGHTPGVIGDDSVVVGQLGDDEDSCRAGRG
jgi:hypothetical protein